ncbi:hypothetical protein SCHPADRAFT_263522 [Schizopora paradoxa]|uniref:Uncharacterized protein n=1 Tax=Schizopora paradoxa TaxID=27342 RepID=A0A0H2RUF3_9AGAM|nr:hypothetical protein SCHPADRAFT_263522 [Schizopora paradoxa]
MAPIDLYDSSQLLWIEVDAVTISDDKEDEVEVLIRNSDGKEEMNSKTVDKKKGDKKDGKELKLKAKCIAFSGDKIIVKPIRGFVKGFIGQDCPPLQESDASSVIQSLDTKEAKDGHTFKYSPENTSVTLHVTMRSLGAVSHEQSASLLAGVTT